MTQASEIYTKTHFLPKGTVMSQFIAERDIAVEQDPVADNIFCDINRDQMITRGDYGFDVVKLPVSEFDVWRTPAKEVIDQLGPRGLAPLYEGFAVLLWHLDHDILQPGEGALVLTGIIEQAMMGRHMLAICRTDDRRFVNWAPIGHLSGLVSSRRPVHWIIAARAK